MLCHFECIGKVVLIDKIAYHKRGTLPALYFHEKLYRGRNVCPFAYGVKGKELAYYIKYVSATFLGRDVFLYPVGKEYHTYLVVVLDSRERKRGGYLRYHVALGAHLRSETHTSRHVDKQHYRKFPFFFEHFYIRSVETCRYVPVNISYVIAVLVFAHFGKAHTLSFKGRMILTRKYVAAQSASLYFNAPYTAKKF